MLIIGFGFCDVQNYQCRGKSYQPRLRLGRAEGEADNSYLDIDNSAWISQKPNPVIVYYYEEYTNEAASARMW